MKRNLDTVNQRGTHINELNQKTEDLQTNSKIFQRGANKVRKEMFCKNVRMTVWIAIGVAILIAILIGVLGWYP